jgi:tetratricopeptide (TPR) repeat protein
MLLADALLHAGSPEEAAIHCRGIAQMNAARARELVRAAERDWRGRQEAAALLKIEEALRLQPTDVETVVLLARCRAASGELERAVRLLEAYLCWNRDRALAIGYLGQLYRKPGRPEQARAWSDLYAAKYGTPWIDIDDAANRASGGSV